MGADTEERYVKVKDRSLWRWVESVDEDPGYWRGPEDRYVLAPRAFKPWENLHVLNSKSGAVVVLWEWLVQCDALRWKKERYEP
jgi:hypothetical protein